MDNPFGAWWRLERYHAEAPDRDFVSGQFDGAFKADLPNGQYPVAGRVNLIANDKNVISNLAVPVGVKLIQLAYQVDATNGQHKSSIPKRRRDTHYSSNGPVVRFAESIVVMNRK